ncbi:MAG: hypothetical protein MR022_05580 [Ruminococcus sp.]|nr:hypothetical protein [Ruminococcus sp.]
MNNFLGNIWTKRVVAVLSLLYALAVCRLCYFSIFYEIHVRDRVSLCLTVTVVSIIALVAMLYTRKQVITRIASFIILPAMLPVVLLYFGEWGMIIPIIITGVTILLLSGAGEGGKTAVGTIVLLMYIFGALGYFVFTSFFVSSAKETLVEKGTSPSGRYRYTVINTEDTSNGSTAVYVEPNYADEDFPFVNFTLKSMDRVVYRVRPIAEEIDIEWTTQSRQDVTQQIEAISDNIEITLTDDELKQLGYTYDNKLTLSDVDIDMKLQIGLDGSNVDPILLDSLNDEQLAVFGIGRDQNERYYILSPSAEVIDSAGAGSGKKIYFSEIDSDTIEKFQSEYLDEYYDYKFKVTKDRTVLLNTLTDEQLKSFGVSDQSDVMTFNGKVCFRSYVAEIEDYYDVDSRHLSIDLLT